ncbi:MAG: hypothetical protein H6977_17110 [Gammaproteobacteria bacterium]|nr:hypothetical protein [Gammaproteobacteria bacterium]MCP5201723.1 hypothetical protein [Gammaproteobacteria bacterium]
MATQELHIPQTTGWRALLTHAQLAGGVQLDPDVEEHLVSLLYRHVGADVSPREIERGLVDRVDRLLEADTSQPAAVGDQCLLFAGLLPEHAIRKGVPVSYFVEVGRNAYREYASKHRSELHEALATDFVKAMDVLQTLRALQSGSPCIDAFNAFHLWHDLGSAHGWRVLRSMTASLPAACPTSQRVH